MDGMQSVFDNATELEKEFDLMFDAEDEDEILSVVQGLKEDGTELPDFDELHQDDNKGTVKDMEDELGPNNDTDNEPTADSNGEFDIEDDELDLACPKTGVADAVTKSEPDPENIEDEADKAADKVEKEFNEAYAALMEEFGIDDGDQGLDNDSDQQEQLEDNENSDVDMKEPVKQEADEDLTDGIEDDIEDEDGDLTDDIEDEIEDGENNDEQPTSESGDLTEEIEDEIIDNIESEEDTQASDAEVKSLENVDDDDILDDILAEE